MKKDLYFDVKFLGSMIIICIALNVALRKKSLDGFMDFNIKFETMRDNNDLQTLNAIKVIGNKIAGENNNLVNWASWDPHDRKKHNVEPAGSYGQHTNNGKKWN